MVIWKEQTKKGKRGGKGRRNRVVGNHERRDPMDSWALGGRLDSDVGVGRPQRLSARVEVWDLAA